LCVCQRSQIEANNRGDQTLYHFSEEMNMASVDIVIPLFNKRRFIGRSIRSILKQTFKNWRLIVVDDGSTDGSAEIVKAFKDDRIELIHQENSGPGAARNTGVAYGNNRFVAFLDADDEWYPWYLANAVSALEANDANAVSTTYYIWPDGRDISSTLKRLGVFSGRYHIDGNEDPVWVSSLWSCMQAWNTVLRREVVNKYNGFYSENHCVFAEEQTFFCRVLFGEPLMIIGPPAVIYHTEDSKWGALHRLHSLEPYLSDPQTVLAYCPSEKQELLNNVLAYRAIRRARHDLLFGEKERAIELVKSFPQVREFSREYNRFLRDMSYKWLPYWARLRWLIGPKVRHIQRALAQKLKLRPKPP
jgi:glycosyltransferase involved in cell wall biosynthesis